MILMAVPVDICHIYVAVPLAAEFSVMRNEEYAVKCRPYYLRSQLAGLNSRKSRCLGLLIAFAVLAPVAQESFAQGTDNGIVVGQAKLYDERSLESMLNSVRSGLGGTNFINPGLVQQNEGLIQGGEMTQSSVSAALGEEQRRTGLAAPAPVSPPSGSGSGASSSTGGSSTSGSGGGSTLKGPGSPETAPATPPLFSSNSIGLSAPLAISSEDMLQQQIGLSFEATNLEMLLEHALSDRLIFTKGGDVPAVPRALAVLGFQVTVEPRTEDKYSVAEAEITITSPDGLARPEVAMMLPQDKTYNVAKVTSDSHSIGLGAFVQPFVGSLSAGSSRNSAYIVYDVDTVALQRPIGSDQSSVSFAWQFRPVLGERSVQPGTRQVYVLLSLPVTSEESYTPAISVKTYWKRLDTKSGTVDDQQISGQNTTYALDPLSIHKTNDYDDGLRPVINDIESHDAGNGQIYIEARGSNFTNNMSVIIDGQAIPLHEQGGRLLAFTAPINALSYSNPIIVGAYGLPVDLVQPSLVDASGTVFQSGQVGEGLTIKAVSVVPLDADSSVVKIQLVARNTVDVPPLLPRNGQLVITIGDQVYGLNDKPVGMEDPDQTPLTTFDVRVPNSVLHAAQKVTVRYLFCGDEYRSDYALPGAAFSVDSATVVSKDKQSVVLALQGNFHQSLTAYIYHGSSAVEFDPTNPVAGSFLLLQAKSSPVSGKGPRALPGGKFHSRGENPFSEPAIPTAIPDPSFNLALLTVQRGQLQGADYLVLYEKGSPAQLLSLAACQKSLGTMNPNGPKNNPTIPMMPSQWEMWGTWNPSSPVTAAQSSNSPGTASQFSATSPSNGSPLAPNIQQNLPIILQLGTQTSTGSGKGKGIPAK